MYKYNTFAFLLIFLFLSVENKTKIFYCSKGYYRSDIEYEHMCDAIQYYCEINRVSDNTFKNLGEKNGIDNYNEEEGKKRIYRLMTIGKLIKYRDNIPEFDLLTQNIQKNSILKDYQNIIIPISKYLFEKNIFSTYIAGFIANFIYSNKKVAKFEDESVYLPYIIIYRSKYAGKNLMDFDLQDAIEELRYIYQTYCIYGSYFGMGILGWKGDYLIKLLDNYLSLAKDKHKLEYSEALQAEINLALTSIDIIEKEFKNWKRIICDYDDIKTQIIKAVEFSFIKYPYEEKKDIEIITELANSIYDLFALSTIDGPAYLNINEQIEPMTMKLFDEKINYKQKKEVSFIVRNNVEANIETNKKDNYDMSNIGLKIIIEDGIVTNKEYFDKDNKEAIDNSLHFIFAKAIRDDDNLDPLFEKIESGECYIKYRVQNTLIELAVYPKTGEGIYNDVIIYKLSYYSNHEDKIREHDFPFFERLPTLRLSSFYKKRNDDFFDDIYELKMKAPFEDKFIFNLDNNIFELIIYDEKGNFKYSILEREREIKFAKDEIILIQVILYSKSFTLLIKPTEHFSLLPYEPLFSSENYDTSFISKDPLIASEIKYTKRKGNALYINCNNPERLLENQDINVLNKIIKKDHLKDQEIFFTMEHLNLIQKDIYVGYRINNIDNKSIYITIKNIGFSIGNTKENWYGLKEWVDFYNTKFNILNKDKLTNEKLRILEKVIPNIYEPSNNQPITYEILRGESIFILGGTSQDSFCGINVFDTANKKIPFNNVVNGVVLFELHGEASGELIVYDDYKKIKGPHLDYYLVQAGKETFARVYKGYDECHGVIDGKAFWEINDLTKPQNLPVKITNFYANGFSKHKQEPHSQILNTVQHSGIFNHWITNSNPQKCLQGDDKNNKECLDQRDNVIGEDLIAFNIYNQNDKYMIIDNFHYDGIGEVANTANWMINYITEYTFVNRGNLKRKIKITMNANGIITALVVDKQGKVIQGSEQFAGLIEDDDNKNNNYYHNFEYSTAIEPHSVTQFYVEYTLLANSCGRVTHQAILE